MSSKEKILFAAIKVFAQKGRHGARMEEIAAESGLNKAMVYYIFRNRDVLYYEVLKFTMMQTHDKSMSEFKTDIEKKLPEDIILRNMIKREFEYFAENGVYMKLFIEAMTNAVDVIRTIMLELRDNVLAQKKEFISQVIQRGKEKGLFRDINSEELYSNIMGMNLMYYLSKPLGDIFCVNTDDPDYLESRKNNIIDLVLYGVLSRK